MAVIEHEARRQVDLIEDGGTIVQETRLFDPDKGETRSLRSKEDAHDYRYFPDPDLLPLELERRFPRRMPRVACPSCPTPSARATRARSASAAYNAARAHRRRHHRALVRGAARARLGAEHRPARVELGHLRTVRRPEPARPGRSRTARSARPRRAELLALIADGTLSGTLAKQVFEIMLETGEGAGAIVEARGLKQTSDTGAIDAAIAEVIAANPTRSPNIAAARTSSVRLLRRPGDGSCLPNQANAPAAASATMHAQAARCSLPFRVILSCLASVRRTDRLAVRRNPWTPPSFPGAGSWAQPGQQRLAAMAALGIDLRPTQARAWTLRIAEAKQYPSVCPYCAVGCDTMIYAKDGAILDIEGDPNSPINQGTLCPKGAAIYQLHVNPNRLTQVLYRRPGATQWETIGLEEAMDMVAERVKKTRDETFEETYEGTERRRQAAGEDPDGHHRHLLPRRRDHGQRVEPPPAEADAWSGGRRHRKPGPHMTLR